MDDGTFRLLETMQTLAVREQAVVSANLANADVPGYEARAFRFREALSQALADGKVPTANEVGRVGEAGRSVNLEEELVDLRRVSLLSRTWSRLLSTHIRGLRAAIGSR